MWIVAVTVRTHIGSGITSCNISMTAIEPPGGQRRCCTLGFGDPPAAAPALAGAEQPSPPRREPVSDRVEHQLATPQPAWPRRGAPTGTGPGGSREGQHG